MSHTPIRLAVALALAATSFAAPAPAQSVFVPPPPSATRAPLTGKRRSVARELQYFGYGDVDVGALSDRKIALLDNAIHSDGSRSRVGSRIHSILYGGFLQRSIDRIGRRN